MKRIDKKNFSDNSREKFLNTKKIEFKFNDGTSVSPTFDVVNNFTTP